MVIIWVSCGYPMARGREWLDKRMKKNNIFSGENLQMSNIFRNFVALNLRVRFPAREKDKHEQTIIPKTIIKKSNNYGKLQRIRFGEHA